MIRKAMMIAAGFACVYLSLIAALYLAQRSMVFVPDRARPDRVAGGVPEMAVVEARTSDGLALRGWFMPPPEDSAKPVLVYFHGNAGNIESRGATIRPWIEDGYGVLLAEYRGYGGNPGLPSEEGLYADAQGWIDWLAGHGILEGRLILYGESLGTGVAIEMALRHPGVRALVLQSGYTSLPDVARRTYFYVPVGLLMKDRFENLEKISSVRVPVLILHGARDDMIPVDQARQVYAAALEPKKIVIFPEGGHNDIPPGMRKAAVDGFVSALSPL